MMFRKGIPGLFDRFAEMSLARKLALFGGLLAVVLVVAAGALMLTGQAGGAGGDADILPTLSWDDEQGDAGAGSQPSAGGGSFSAMTDDDLSTAVAATVEALLPTATPVPTPDVAATVEADLAARRVERSVELDRNPLDSQQPRNPHLTGAEVAALAAMGESVWASSMIYLELLQVVNMDFPLLTREFMSARAGQTGRLAGQLEVSEEARPDRDQSLSDVVSAYIDHLDRGISAIQAAAREVHSAASVFDAAGVDEASFLGEEERQQLWEHYLAIERVVFSFHSVMSVYGCSACGELFRHPGR